MNNWILTRLQYLSEGSSQCDLSGQLPLSPRYKKTFKNTETGQLRETTDLDMKIYNRNKYFDLFKSVYLVSFQKKQISILSVVVNQEEYPTISKFINTITRKLKRKGIARLGYVWARDVGEKFFKHFHILIATERINENLFNELFSGKKHNNYEVQFVRTPKGISKYITDKDLYGAKRQRTYGKSRYFPNPSKIIPELTRLDAN